MITDHRFQQVTTRNDNLNESKYKSIGCKSDENLCSRSNICPGRSDSMHLLGIHDLIDLATTAVKIIMFGVFNLLYRDYVQSYQSMTRKINPLKSKCSCLNLTLHTIYYVFIGIQKKHPHMQILTRPLSEHLLD